MTAFDTPCCLSHKPAIVFGRTWHQIEYQRAATVCDPAVAEECVADYLWYGTHGQRSLYRVS